MKKYLVEFIGTFFFVLTICMAVIGGLGNFAPLAIGVVLMVMVYAGGHISGAHYNPAVTFAVYLRGKLALGQIAPYIIAQAMAGVLAALLSGYLLGTIDTATVPPMEVDVAPALIAEFLGAFALCYVILNVATAQSTAGNSYYGLAIGFTVMGLAYIFGAISGGAFNPAVAVGITAAGIVDSSAIWIYLVATFAGGALSAFVFNYTNGPE